MVATVDNWYSYLLFQIIHLTDLGQQRAMGTTAFSDAAAQYPDVTQEMQDDMARVDATQITSKEQNDRMLYTLNLLHELARYLVGIPGRKNVIWYSASFPLDVEPYVVRRPIRTTR